MSKLESEKPFAPGFQGTETSSAEVVVYSAGDDPVLSHRQADVAMRFEGRSEGDQLHSLFSVQTSNRLGAGSGSFVIGVKQAQGAEAVDLRDQILDDDWVDITFTRHERRWHTMRGLVDEVRREKGVDQNGTAHVKYQIVGRSFGRIFEITPIWYNRFTGENALGANALQVFQAQNGLRAPNDIVRRILFGFLDDLGNVGRAVWRLPSALPNISQDRFAKEVTFVDGAFRNDPARIGINANLMDPQGVGIWNLAHEWSDPQFAELFTDLWLDESPPRPVGPEEEFPEDNSRMVVVFRDRPFPTIEEGTDSPYFSLPLFDIPPQQLVESDVGRGGLERYNAFVISPQLTQELQQGSISLAAPLWDLDDILRHGLRRLEYSSRYKSADANLITLTREQRARLRDWHWLNAYFYNGTLQLGVGRPDIKIGTRARIVNEDPAKQETYYVESVSHNWQLKQGVKTSLGVTRGWRGDDRSYLSTLQEALPRYAQSDAVIDEKGVAFA